MNEASDPSRVINLSQRLDPTSERVGELLGAVRDIASKRLQQWVGNAFERVDDALFDLAEKAENNAAQMHYFDGMREVRKRRPAVERNFLGAISRHIGELAHPPQQSAGPSMSFGTVELTLVADNELEESLAITSMIGKNESRLSRDLFAVNQRLSVICGGRKVEDASNPVAPAILAQAFRQALHELSADMRVKLIIYKLFDRYVLSSLEELYQEINTELVRAGVLPQLPGRRPGRRTRRPATSPATCCRPCMRCSARAAVLPSVATSACTRCKAAHCRRRTNCWARSVCCRARSPAPARCRTHSRTTPRRSAARCCS